MKSARLLLAASMLATAASGAARDGDRLYLGSGPTGDFTGHVRSMQELKFAGVERQQYDFSCGSAALATLLRLYGDPHGEAEAFRGMWADGDRTQIRKLGFSLLDMKRYLQRLGRGANGYKVTLDAVANAGVPGIALITVKGYRHFVVVQGVRRGEVLIGDPSLGLHVETAAEFGRTWNGVFFAIDGDLPTGHAAFNADPRWSAFARAPLGARFADPLSLQALSLTAPFYRDF